MLGHKLVQVLDKRFEVWATIRESYESSAAFGIFNRVRTIQGVDALKLETVLDAIEISKPDVVINAIGIVKQIEPSKNVVTALSVNSILPQRLAEIRKSVGFRFINISTVSSVFDDWAKFVKVIPIRRINESKYFINVFLVKRNYLPDKKTTLGNLLF